MCCRVSKSTPIDVEFKKRDCKYASQSKLMSSSTLAFSNWRLRYRYRLSLCALSFSSLFFHPYFLFSVLTSYKKAIISLGIPFYNNLFVCYGRVLKILENFQISIKYLYSHLYHTLTIFDKLRDQFWEFTK